MTEGSGYGEQPVTRRHFPDGQAVDDSPLWRPEKVGYRSGFVWRFNNHEGGADFGARQNFGFSLCLGFRNEQRPNPLPVLINLPQFFVPVNLPGIGKLNFVVEKSQPADQTVEGFSVPSEDKAYAPAYAAGEEP
jgi:hypothetical protein